MAKTEKPYFVLNTCDCGKEHLEQIEHSGNKLWIQAYCPSCVKEGPIKLLIVRYLEAKIMEKKEIISVIKKMDSKLKPSEPAFKVACVLLASATHGAHEPTIAKLLDIPLDDVQVWGERLRENKVWVGKRVDAEWMHPETGGIAFWLDAQVAMGLLIRNKDHQYKMTDAARRYVESRFKKHPDAA